MPCGVVLSSSGLVSTRSNRITAVPYLSPCRHAAIATFTGYPSTAAPLHGTGYSPTTRPALSDLTGFRSTASTSVIVIVPSEACYAAYLSPARMGPRTSAGYVCRWRFPGAPAPYVTRQAAFEAIRRMPLCCHTTQQAISSSKSRLGHPFLQCDDQGYESGRICVVMSKNGLLRRHPLSRGVSARECQL